MAVFVEVTESGCNVERQVLDIKSIS